MIDLLRMHVAIEKTQLLTTASRTIGRNLSPERRDALIADIRRGMRQKDATKKHDVSPCTYQFYKRKLKLSASTQQEQHNART